MEDRRTLLFSTVDSYELMPNSPYDHEFVGSMKDNYFRYSQLILPGFFDAATPEAQDKIIRDNFGRDIHIASYHSFATSLNMTPQTFILFLHIASHAALEAFDSATQSRNMAEQLDSSRDSKRKKKSKKSKKKKHIPESSDQDSADPDFFNLDKILKAKEVSDEYLFRRPSRRSKHKQKEPIEERADDAMLHDTDEDAGETRTRSSRSKNDVIGTSSGTQQIADLTVEMEIADTPNFTQPQVDQHQLNPPAADQTRDLRNPSKKKKSNRNEVFKVLTGYTPTDDGTSRVRDILVYDIPVSWTAEQIVQHLTLWGKTISIQTKRQRKYQTLRVKIELSSFRLAQFEGIEYPNPVWTTDLGGLPVRWFPSRWNLKERKQREKFQATIRKIPDSMTLATLWTEQRPHSFLSEIKGLKSFKIIQTARGERKLIGYFEKWDDMQNALGKQFVWEQQHLSWIRHDSPKQPTPSSSKKTQKERASRNKSNQPNSKNSKKKSDETKSKKPKKQKKDKSQKTSRVKLFAELFEVFCKLI